MSRTDDCILSREDGECDRCGELLDLTAVLGDECVMVGGRPLCLSCYEEDADDLGLEDNDFYCGEDDEDIDPDTLSDEDL
jgi:hypothetical protein